jgi:beta-phosphoglucomutase
MRKAVIFDLDGVITDTARYHYLAWKQMANQIGIDIDEEFNETLKGVDRMGSLDRILARGNKQYTEKEKLALADSKNEHYKELIKGITASDLLPGALAALKSLRAIGVKTGLASVSKNASTIVDRLGITDLFDYVVDANLIKKGKPDPEIFLKAAQELHVSPAECIGVEDAVVGIQAIKSAGMYAIGVGDPKILNQADQVIPNLTTFPIGAAYQAIS